MRAPRRILFSIGSLDQGGAELQLTTLAVDLARRGWDCHFFVFDDTGPHRGTLQRAGIPVYACNRFFAAQSHRRYPKRMSRPIPPVLGYIGTLLAVRPSVTQSFLPLTNTISAVCGRLLRVPVVVTGHRAMQTHQSRSQGTLFADRIASWCADFATANSEAVARDVVATVGSDRKKIAVIPNGIDFSRFAGLPSRAEARSRLGIPPDVRVVMVVANLLPYKGHLDLVRVLPLLTERHPELRLVLVGADRGLGPSLVMEARILGVDDQLELHGPHSNPEQLLKAADVFVLPSHEEGFPNALIEAMSVGVPVVATAVGGIPEALDGGRRGVLVPARDPMALASAISDVLDNPAAARARAEIARSEMRSYDRVRMAESYEALYERLLHRAGR